LVDRVYYRNQYLTNRVLSLTEENKKLRKFIKENINELNVLQEGDS